MASCRQFRQSCDEDAVLRKILEGTATETGERFFAALVENLAKVLNTQGAWVTEYLEESRRLRALAFWLGGQWIQDYEYDIVGTPCEAVVKDAHLVHIPDNVPALFPDNPDLKEVGAVSYMGVPLLDINRRILGHLAVVDTRPMPKEPRNLAVFRVFASRAAAEVERLRAESRIRDREEKLAALVDSAMDAIVEIDQNLNVKMMNRAAEQVFRCVADQVIDRSLCQLLTLESCQKLSGLVQKLDVNQEGQRCLWISGGLEGLCTAGDQFPLEATLSQFKMGRETLYALILRNVNERLEAEKKIRSLTIETEYLREEVKALHNFGEIIGKSEPLLRVLREVGQVAETDATALIHGETGTGKELIARAIHSASRRHDKPLIKVNCAAIPPTLIESELFGHEKGAFTGATSRRDGRFALADGGTIFLDEVGELPKNLQMKLLRVLQEGEFEPVGSSKTRKVDVRVIAASNRDLSEAVQEGDFRVDLYYRLNVFPIELPPLRQRGDDIGLLASFFAQQCARRMGRTSEPLSRECIGRLKAYDWPGNVRELQNVIERAMITSENGRLDLDRALPETAKRTATETMASREEKSPSIRTAQQLHQLERDNLILALDATGWRVAGRNGAAQLLGMPPSTLSSRIKALGVKRPS